MPKPDEYLNATDIWVNVGDFSHFACCECGFVHSLKYRWRNGRLQERWTYDPKETRAQRRWLKVKVVRGSKSRP